MKFLQLDDALFDDLAQNKTLHSAVRMVEGTGGWTSVGSPWIVPEALLSSRSASLVQKQVCPTMLRQVLANTRARMQRCIQHSFFSNFRGRECRLRRGLCLGWQRRQRCRVCQACCSASRCGWRKSAMVRRRGQVAQCSAPRSSTARGRSQLWNGVPHALVSFSARDHVHQACICVLCIPGGTLHRCKGHIQRMEMCPEVLQVDGYGPMMAQRCSYTYSATDTTQLHMKRCARTMYMYRYAMHDAEAAAKRLFGMHVGSMLPASGGCTGSERMASRLVVSCTVISSAGTTPRDPTAAAS